MRSLTHGWSAFLLVIALANAAMVMGAGVSDEESKSIVLSGARIVTQADLGTIVGDILIEDGRVTAIGNDLSIPDDARRVDVTGMVVTPGLIDARSSLWLTSAASREGASDGSLNVLDGVDPLAEDWQEVSRQGVTAVYVQPSQSGNLGGAGAVLRVAPATSVEDLTIKATAAAQAAIGTTSSSRTSRNRYTQYDRVKKALEAAKKYGDQIKAYEDYQKKKKAADDKSKKKKTADGDDKKKKSDDKEGEKKDPPEKNGDSGKPATSSEKSVEEKKSEEEQGKDDAKKETTKSASGSSKPPTKPTKDAAKDFLLRVIKGEIPLRIEAHREDDVRHALKLADDLEIRVVIDGASNPRKMLADLLDRRTPLVIGPVIRSSSPPSYRVGRPEDLLSQLTASEGRWALATFADRPRASRALRIHVAAAIAAGVDPAKALRAITTDAAAILGVKDKLGAIAKQRIADLVVFAGDPLDPSSPVRLVMSQGKIVYESDVEPPARIAVRGESSTLTGPLPESYAIVTKRLLWPNGRWGPGTVVVNRGKIAAIAEATNGARDVRTMDLGETPVTTGLLVAHTDMGSRLLVDDRVDSNAANLLAVDAYDPSNRRIRKLIRSGFLRAAVAPGSTTVVSGNVGLVRLGAIDPICGDACAMKIVLTSNARNSERYPASLSGQVELVRKVLRGEALDSELFLPEAVRRELIAEREKRLDAILKQKKAVLFEVSEPAEIRAALGLIDEFELRGVLVGADEVGPFVGDLKRQKVGLVARPVRPEGYDRYTNDLVAASDAGIPVAFGSGMGSECRATAAMLVAAGMSRELALSALTDGGASMLGLRDEDCMLVEGAAADFVVWDGSPLDLRSKPTAIIIDGKLLGEGAGPEPQRATPSSGTSPRVARGIQ